MSLILTYFGIKISKGVFTKYKNDSKLIKKVKGENFV